MLNKTELVSGVEPEGDNSNVLTSSPEGSSSPAGNPSTLSHYVQVVIEKLPRFLTIVTNPTDITGQMKNDEILGIPIHRVNGCC